MKKGIRRAAERTLGFLFFFEAVSWLTMRPAHAYIDPSAVTYVVQAVAGIVIALGAAFAIFRHKIFAFFRGKRGNAEESGDQIVFKEGAEEDGDGSVEKPGED